MKNKKVKALLTCACVTATVFASSIAMAADIKVKIDGVDLNFDDQAPTIVDGRTLVPMRAIFEKLGATIEWQEETKTVVATKGAKIITIQIGSQSAKVDKTAMRVDVPAQIINGRTMVPVRFIATALGSKVDWKSASSTVEIQTEEALKIEAEKAVTANAVSPEVGAFSKSGGWAVSALAGADATKKSIWVMKDPKAYAMYTPTIKEKATVKVSVYKIYYKGNTKQNYEITHDGKVDKKVVDFSKSPSEWVELGTFEFAGDGNENVKLLAGSGARAAEVKFEILSGADKGKELIISASK